MLAAGGSSAWARCSDACALPGQPLRSHRRSMRTARMPAPAVPRPAVEPVVTRVRRRRDQVPSRTNWSARRQRRSTLQPSRRDIPAQDPPALIGPPLGGRRDDSAAAPAHRLAPGRHARAHLPRLADGHVRDRSGGADRSRAGGGRRPGAARRVRAGQGRARPASAAVAAVPGVCRQGAPGRLRQIGADREPGAAGHPARVSGDPRARERRDPARRRARACPWA